MGNEPLPAWKAEADRLKEHESFFKPLWWNENVNAFGLMSDDEKEGKTVSLTIAMRIVSPDIRADFSVMPWYRAYLKAQNEKSDVPPAEATLPKTFASRMKHHLNPEHLCCRIYNGLERTILFGHTTPRSIKKVVRAGAMFYNKYAYSTISNVLDSMSGVPQPVPCQVASHSSPSPC